MTTNDNNGGFWRFESTTGLLVALFKFGMRMPGEAKGGFAERVVEGVLKKVLGGQGKKCMHVWCIYIFRLLRYRPFCFVFLLCRIAIGDRQCV